MFKTQNGQDVTDLLKDWIFHSIEIIKIGFDDKTLIDEVWAQMNIDSTIKEDP